MFSARFLVFSIFQKKRKFQKNKNPSPFAPPNFAGYTSLHTLHRSTSARSPLKHTFPLDFQRLLIFKNPTKIKPILQTKKLIDTGLISFNPVSRRAQDTTWNTLSADQPMMTMIAFITLSSSLVPLIKGLCRNRTDDLGINSPPL